ncbi:riboflavin synthase [Sphingomonas sp. SORGH_AS802]|uniref:riboflavin synthase n=1 Tax=unclassified Sphingomonas TaxID=196159 RepID=UPI0028655446|nr:MULTISPECIES: riboflavin synthase [unclassified Sphingomonas]MDR6128552.1 riboflavin synthase [Sphingomonas sp. SORGH_AS_0438]MDR6135247.1 riboflavin synthase [Sphingomonas sp. SORGH_AS_0802]
MFTGIVSDLGTIRSVESRGDTRVVIGTAYDPATIDLGASIACSGVCLTVVDKGRDAEGGWFAVDVSAETLAKTADQWQAGHPLNLERALKLGDELGGHIVTGHVDGVGHVTEVTPEGDSKRIAIRVPAAIGPYLATKGSVTIDGVSLTVNSVTDDTEDGADGTVFGINVIPHTQAVTTIGTLTPGARVNIEIDVLARYLQRMEQYRAR